MLPLLTLAATALMAAGVLASLASLAVAVVGRRPGLAPRDLFRAGGAVTSHPDRYVRPTFSPAVRALSVAGGVLFAAGAAILAVRVIAGLITRP